MNLTWAAVRGSSVARELRDHGGAGRRRRWRRRSPGCPWCRSGRRRRRSAGVRARAPCRPRCAGRRAPPGSGRAAAAAADPRASARDAARAGRPRSHLDLVAQQLPGAAAESNGRTAGAARARRRVVVAARACRWPRAPPARRPMHTGPPARSPRSFTPPIVADRLPHGSAGPQGSSQRGRRLVPAQEKQSSHMHVGAVADLRGPAAGARRVLEHIELASAAGAALPPEARRPALRDGPAVLGRRPAASTSTTTCATRRCRSRAATISCASWPGAIFSQRLDRSKPLWELWLVQGLEDNRFALISKTHHALVDGVVRRRPRDRAVRPARRSRRVEPRRRRLDAGARAVARPS